MTTSDSPVPRCMFCQDPIKLIGSFWCAIQPRPGMLFSSRCPERPLYWTGDIMQYGFHQVEEPAREGARA